MKSQRSPKARPPKPEGEPTAEALDSQLLLKATLDSSFNFIQVFKAVRDQTGQIIDFIWVLTNRRWQQAYGDVIGKSLLQQNPAVVQTGIFARMIDVTQTGVSQTHEHYYPFEQFNGWFQQTLTKLQDGVVLTTEEITPRKQTEEALRTSEQKYHSLFDLVGAGYCIIRLSQQADGPLDYQFVEVNKAFEQLTGLANAQGQWMRQLRPKHEEYWFDIYHQVALTGQSVEFEHLARELGPRWYKVRAFRLGDVSRNQVAILFEDITTEKQAAEAEKEAARRKDEFLAMLAHELRNPMATLHNTLLLLELTHGQDEALPLDKALAMMSREVIHLGRMVDDLLDVSRINQGKIQLKKERLDLSGLIREALEAARPQFVNRGQTLRIQLPNKPIWVDGDRTRLTQVVRNLLNNATKYTPNGGQIGVTLDKENRQAELRIHDSGIGIAPDQLEAIFDVFFQVSSSLDRPQGGLGLGLTVVKQLVELHGGQVRVQSPGLGQGTEFTVRLPLLPDVPASIASAGDGEGGVRKAGHILVVDDNADLAQTTAMLLRVKKYEAHLCLSGPEALQTILSRPPDAVLLDLGMPGMDGYETCRRLRAMDWGRHGIIVALSGYGQEEDKKRTQEAGFDGHLVKPVNLQMMTELLNKLLNDAQSGSD